jgi:hypothetical protein
LKAVKSQLSATAQADIDRALSGDAIAARRLAITSPKRLLGHIVFLAYQMKTENPAYRTLMRALWQPETCGLMTLVWSPHIVRRMLARANFESAPLHTPLTIFRPVKTSVRQAAMELCWTLSRSTATAEALKAHPCNPRIVSATITPADVLFFEGAAGGRIVTRRPPQGLIVDPVHGGDGIAIAKPNELGRNRPASGRS